MHVVERLEVVDALDGVRLLTSPLFPAEAVDRPIACRGRDPRAGVVGHAVHRPAFERDRERLLDRFLRQLEVAEHADERRDRSPRLAAEQAVDDVRCLGHMSMSGLTSTDPYLTAGSFPAASIASSKLAHSMM